jgi:hypothetical protein
VEKKGNCWPELVEFLITLGKQNGERNRVLCAEILLSCKRELVALSAGLLFRSAPIRVREKRMNTYMTLKTRRSYQKAVK